MLSVLIPIFDCPIGALLKSLHEQLLEANIPFEILISDNAESSSYRIENLETIDSLLYSRHFVETKYVGRSSNRNFLADQAQYPWLLFLDGDTAIPDKTFIARYIAALKLGDVICGGTRYSENAPDSKDKLLRWVYGKKKEEVPVGLRTRAPWRNYSSFNFVIHKNVFQSIRFDDTLTQYGHEDTLFGRELKKLNIPVIHIDNPLLHLGLDDAIVFIEKTRLGVENLWKLIQNNRIDEEVSLYKWFNRAEQFGTKNSIAFLFDKREASMLKNLTGPKPNLVTFGFFKLGYLCRLAR
jgi:glycosyltransferase involved in cell wall biosynthesis